MNRQPKLKKKFGQHFLRDSKPIDAMIATIPVTKETTVIEIGCGDGVLTRAILHQTPCKSLQVFEIDPEWAYEVRSQTDDPRLEITVSDVLDVDLPATLGEKKPLVLMANLPYAISFPLFQKLITTGTLISHGMVMVQEEAAQRMVSSSGRRYGSISLLLQYYFTFTLHQMIPPTSFYPAPKVNSRLVEFVPRTDQKPIPDAVNFWKFTRACFKTPRQTLGNNLKRTNHAWQKLDAKTLRLRAQQLNLDDFIVLWDRIRE